ncbi:MAG: extracellular solute-binding protein [Chloroflexota bacterium]|nr:extracellular solute-binding protein [Chloroflexota bacterium]MDE2947646.1 extracellular solute-binding protein [Chloroflexota bacterium]
MESKTLLRGITWNHSRGFLSVVATAQRFSEMCPEVEIRWEKRSLQAFADAPIQGLAEEYDLLVIDHPWAGYAAYSQVLLPLQDLIPDEFMRDQAANSVGHSHASYIFDGSQCALAIDAATPVASYRPDLLARYELEQPQTWRELLALARKGRVIMPGIPIDTLMNFYMLCATQGEAPFIEDEWALSDGMSLRALEQLRELASLCPPAIFDWNPIAVYEALSRRDDFVYCPFAYGYSNYARSGYADKLLMFDDMVDINGQGRCQTTLGGTGLAISARCQALEIARDYAMFTASPAIQGTLFFDSGGQPGHRSAWLDAEVNRRSNNYFRNTLPALDRAYLRPRFPGYLHFQDHAGAPIREYLMQGGNGRDVLAALKRLFKQAKALYRD